MTLSVHNIIFYPVSQLRLQMGSTTFNPLFSCFGKWWSCPGSVDKILDFQCWGPRFESACCDSGALGQGMYFSWPCLVPWIGLKTICPLVACSQFEKESQIVWRFNVIIIIPVITECYYLQLTPCSKVTAEPGHTYW